MKKFKRNHLASSSFGPNRRGLSVIEVLTSIVVALIGVFGVLAMIPFAVKQTQSGLDQDAATSLARSALSNFEANGYKIVSSNTAQLNWVGSAGTITASAASPLVCIDPLGVAESDPTGNPVFNAFPFNSNSPITMPVVSLLRADGNLFDRADARRMFRITDDLVFAQDDNPDVDESALLGPVQTFNEGPGGLLNRQSIGAVSWCAVAEPIVSFANSGQEVGSYKFYVLVFKDRVISTPALATSDSIMAAGQVISPANEDPMLPLQPLTTVTSTALGADIRLGDWVMLINTSTPAAPLGGDTNIAFARVNNLVNSINDRDDPNDDTTTLTLNGPDFSFTGAPNTTTVVHLKDVVAVFPRTINLESSSEWNVNN